MDLTPRIEPVNVTAGLDSYFASIDHIAQSGHEHADYLDIIHAKRLANGANHKFNYFYENDGPSNIGGNALSRTALAHKILFDYTQSDIKVFANGLHPNIYDSEIVINSFKKYVERVITTSVSFTPIEIIAKGLNTDHSSSHLFDSKFLHSAKELQHLYGQKILAIYGRPKEKADVEITPIRFSNNDSDHTVEVLNDNILKEINRINAFCLYGDFYRFRLFHPHKNHFALINFGDSKVANVLRSNFESIKQACNEIEI